jgi:hypothetical protein
VGRRATGRSAGLSLGGRVRRRLRRPLPLLICIDVEPDERQVDPDRPSWAGFERLFERAGELRSRIASLADGPTVINWFVRADPQVAHVHGSAGWAFVHYADEWGKLRGQGDEIAIHAHAWRLEDDGTTWFIDHGNPAWVRQCVQLAIDSYRDAFGNGPNSSRGGDRFLNGEVIDLLERSGVTADLTVEPRMRAVAGVGDDARSTGSLPDYTTAPENAYHPAIADFLTPAAGERRLAMIPLTSGGPEVLYPWMDAHQFSERLNERLADGEISHLAFALRSDIALDDETWERTLVNLERVPHIVGVAAERRCRTTTADEFARSLR